MTVCIAAICTLPDETRAIVAVSDRMLTAGDIEFEPQQQKVYSLAPRAPLVAILVAGDVPAQISICDATFLRLPNERVPGQSVESIARIYAEEYTAYRQRESEQVLLSPLGLTLESFVERQRSMTPEQVQSLVTQLQNYNFDPEAMVCGVDDHGAHIFTIKNPGLVFCNDSVGFDAIGIGARHAKSQFMLAGYERRWPLSHALLLTYSAKRRAEVAPGVGRGTDLIFMEPGGTGLLNVSDEIHDKLQATYSRMTDDEVKAAASAREEVDGFIRALFARAVPTPPSEVDASGPSSPASPLPSTPGQ